MLSAVVPFIVTLLLGMPQAPATDSRIATIQVKGVARYKPEEVTRLTGLAIGNAVAVADLTAAANRLASTGLFDSVRYTYTTGRAVTVTFEVQEAKWSVPVILDNFVSIPDAELIAAIAREVPSFDGTAPINAGAAEFLTKAIQGVLTARSIPGRVEFNTQADIRQSGPPRYLFAVRDPSPKVCGVKVTGASALSDKDLVAPLQGVIGGDYSRYFMESAAKGTLTDMYRRKGYWRAAFATPTALVDPCGVTVTLSVSEGAQYMWDRAEWSGHSVHPAEVLNKALGMKAGEPADASKIDTGLREVRRAYGKVGYIREYATFEPVLDDAARKAVFAIEVHEGDQYRMGTLDFTGIRDSDAAALARKWTLKAGDVYDEEYESKYAREVIYPLQTAGGARPHLESKVDAEKRVVNLTVAFR